MPETVDPEAAGTELDRLWRIEPAQDLRFAGWDWGGVLVFADGPGDTHQLSHLAATVLQILVDAPRSGHELLTELEPHLPPDESADLAPVLAETLRGLQRIGLVRQSTPGA